MILEERKLREEGDVKVMKTIETLVTGAEKHIVETHIARMLEEIKLLSETTTESLTILSERIEEEGGKDDGTLQKARSMLGAVKNMIASEKVERQKNAQAILELQEEFGEARTLIREIAASVVEE